MTDAVIIPFPRRGEVLKTRRTLARRVTCPECGATPGKPCTVKGSPVIRLRGPHPDRIAAAEAAEGDDYA